ncbi:MAG: hypothetical protein KKD31_03570 [Bacteroidetes bacterium]|nr:hypothetical protein [Bacteroidota bacterium]
MEENNTPEMQAPKPPTVLDGMMQPGFPVKVFTTLFFENCVVFCKTGSFATDSAGTMRSALGGYTGAGLIMGAVGTLVDHTNRESRVNKAAAVAALEPQKIVAAHSRNFMLPYSSITSVELKGPNFAGELRVKVYAGGKKHKFRMDKQSKSTGKYITDVFNEFLAGKVVAR